ncbi:MAG: LysR substrate-binding domain-containing protein [Alcaligenaceae bacterium]|nr:LysR substrate-binding domain-containing protein [Alcaligenaceae bacterium]
MDLRQLKYFARIVELESMTAAAQSLFVAQPSLSQHIANLEASVGTKLLLRSVQGTKPTPAGEMLYKYAKAILRQVDEASTALRQGLEKPVGRVSVGLPFSTLQMIGAELIAAVQKDHRNDIVLEISEGSTAGLAEQVNRQLLDLAVIAESRAGANYDAVPLVVEELLVVGPAASDYDSSISLRELASLELILPAFPNSVRTKVENACLERNLPYAILAESACATLMARIAESGAGWTVLPWAATQGLGRNLKLLRLKDVSLQRTLSLCTSKAAADSAACRTVRSLIHRIVEQKLQSGVWKHARAFEPASGHP